MIKVSFDLSSLKKLLDPERWEHFKSELLMKIGAELQSRVQFKINNQLWKKSSGRLQNSINFKVVVTAKESYITVGSSVNYAKWQEQGVRPHVMAYLLNSTKAIPLQTSQGTIFRRATLKSIGEGKWRHPGYSGKWFFRKSLEEVIPLIPFYIRETLQRMLM